VAGDGRTASLANGIAMTQAASDMLPRRRQLSCASEDWSFTLTVVCLSVVACGGIASAILRTAIQSSSGAFFGRCIGSDGDGSQSGGFLFHSPLRQVSRTGWGAATPESIARFVRRRGFCERPWRFEKYADSIRRVIVGRLPGTSMPRSGPHEAQSDLVCCRVCPGHRCSGLPIVIGRDSEQHHLAVAGIEIDVQPVAVLADVEDESRGVSLVACLSARFGLLLEFGAFRVEPCPQRSMPALPATLDLGDRRTPQDGPV